ncbi:hypothetical protein [Raineyella fluvialis]|uniref:Uncharacterized protein n=1 Tax=Raineyella fluvialis TaxID=2662261 RepID=A0A5Q2FI60_9ACTN|nr:hypothetical protein [Raineyella fluvialis]QGF24046.1 hypothetical protein Rai3103_10545 [Raineyella fluvialis]
MRTIPLTLTCSCGEGTSVALAAGQAWSCGCGRVWEPDPTPFAAALAAAAGLRRVRQWLGLLLALVALVGGLLALTQPAWWPALPVLVGGVAIASGPTYRRRLRTLRERMRSPIGLTPVDARPEGRA